MKRPPDDLRGPFDVRPKAWAQSPSVAANVTAITP